MRDATRFLALRVLVVDDCPDTTGTLALLLEAWGHRVWVAHDGPTALETAREFRPDVMISDIALPGFNGWELAHQVRALAGLKEALLVAVSGYAQENDLRHSCEAGYNLHLIKPVDPEYFKQLLLARATELAQALPESAERPNMAVPSP